MYITFLTENAYNQIMSREIKEDFTGDAYLLYRVARDYYQYDLPQKEIAIRENISRPHVSRLLKKAKESGIVNIEINKPNLLSTIEIAESLKKLSGLKNIEVVPCNEYQFKKQDEISRVLSDYASVNLTKYLVGAKKIGVGIGKTLYSSVKKMLPYQLYDSEIIPMIGIANKCSSSMQCNLIVSFLSDATKANGYFTNVPIVVDKGEINNSLFVSRYEELKENWDNLDVAIVGLGVPYNSPKQEFILNEATDAYKKIIAKSKNVGDLLVSYFRKDGSEVIVRNSYLKMSVSLEQLQKTPTVICIAGGENKVNGIATAISMKYINSLITDVYTAKRLIEIFEKKDIKEDLSNV